MDIRVNNYKIASPNMIKATRPSFRGELENKFFEAVRKGNKKESIQLLNNIKFDVLEKDAINGNNFLHVVCKEKSQVFFNKAIKLLKLNVDKIQELLSMKNKENKVPYDYLNQGSEGNYRSINEFTDYIFTLRNSASAPLKSQADAEQEKVIKTAVATGATVAVALDGEEVDAKEAKEQQGIKTQLVGNEITEKIDLDDFTFETGIKPEEKTEAKPPVIQKVVKSGVNAIVGNKNLVGFFNKEIIQPIQKNKNVFTNGVLIHGFSGTGKTFAIEKLAEELDRRIVPASYVLQKSEKGLLVKESLDSLIDKSIIKINPDDAYEMVGISEILKDYYKKTNKQGIVFIDEVQKFFPADKSYVNNIRATQALENSSRNGMVLLATTQDVDSIDQSLLNSLRFEKMIELRLPKKEDIIELIKRNITIELSDKEIEKMAKKLNGFSYSDVTRIIEKTQYYIENPTITDYEKQIEDYAQEHSILGLSEEGTTSAYDTYIKRTVISENGPHSLDDVSGMAEVKAKLKKVFDPVKKFNILQHFFRENKVKKPNGILLYGPPGCGKTFIMTAIAAETGLPLYQMKFSDISSSFRNETEKNIKKAFDQLRKKYRETGEPSILFFDECDSFFAKNKQNESDNTRALNTLKEEMNNAGEDGIFIVAATNEKDNLNTAIVRDGRFDTKIEVGYPDAKAREALITRALSSPALVKNKNKETIEELTRLTQGLSNASIAGLFSTLQYEKGTSISTGVNSREDFDKKLEDSPIELDEIQKFIMAKKEEINKMKLKTVDRTGLEWQAKTAAYDEFKERVYYTANDPKGLDDVVGMEKVKREMRLKVLAPLNPITKKLFEEEKIPLGGGIILHGPGGVGKTFIVKATAAESKIPLYEMKISEEGSSFVNRTSKNIQNLFNQLKRKYKETGEPSILFLDECDSLLGVSKSAGGTLNTVKNDIINTLKQELSVAQANGIVVIAATNNYYNLDPVVTRSGRFDSHIKIDYPDAKAREAFLVQTLKKRPSTEDLCKNQEELNALIELTEGLSNADIKTAVEKAVLFANEPFVNATIDFVKVGEVDKVNEIQKKKVSLEDLKIALTTKLEEVMEQRSNNENSAY